jgi:hypothetical protein
VNRDSTPTTPAAFAATPPRAGGEFRVPRSLIQSVLIRVYLCSSVVPLSVLPCAFARLRLGLEAFADHPLDRAQFRVHRERLRTLRDGNIGVLQTVPGQRADDGAALADLPELEVLQHAGERNGGSRLAEQALRLREQSTWSSLE